MWDTLLWFWVSHSVCFSLELYWKPNTIAYKLQKGKLARISCFLFGLSEAADLLEGNRCSLLLPVTVQPVKAHRHRSRYPGWCLGAKALFVYRWEFFSAPVVCCRDGHSSSWCLAVCRHPGRYRARENLSLEKVVCFSKSNCIFLPSCPCECCGKSYFVHRFNSS